ncbi:MAG: hypothetical protein ACKO7W_04700 [Elainella sp.]
MARKTPEQKPQRSDTDRTTINLTPIVERLDGLRTDSAWQMLTRSKQVMLLLTEALDREEAGEDSQLAVVQEFILLLMRGETPSDEVLKEVSRLLAIRKTDLARWVKKLNK